MMRYSVRLILFDLVRDNGEAFIKLQRVSVDHLTIEASGDFDGKLHPRNPKVII